MIPGSETVSFSSPSFPRVSGDDPVSTFILAVWDKFSPRERG